MKIDLRGRTALVTGGCGAIGSAMARKFSLAGADVIISDLSPHKGKTLVEEISKNGVKAKFILGDVSDKQSMEDLCSESIREFGKIDILVNNAGVNDGASNTGLIYETESESWERDIGINLTGTYYCSKPVTMHMVEMGYGRVINISSILGEIPMRMQSGYSVAKAGIIGLTKSMAMELADFGITVNTICPGSIVNEELAKRYYSNKEKSNRFMSHVPLRRPGTPNEIAGATVFLASNEASYMTGSVMVVDGGWICGAEAI